MDLNKYRKILNSTLWRPELKASARYQGDLPRLDVLQKICYAALFCSRCNLVSSLADNVVKSSLQCNSLSEK